MDQFKLGKKIQELRKLKGLTQEELADKTNLSTRTIQRIENGEVDARTYTLSRLAEALNVELDILLVEDESSNNFFSIDSSNFALLLKYMSESLLQFLKRSCCLPKSL